MGKTTRYRNTHSACHENKHAPHGRSFEFQNGVVEGWGVKCISKAKVLRRKYEVYLEFPDGWLGWGEGVGVQIKPLPYKGYEYFLEHHIWKPLNNSSKQCLIMINPAIYKVITI